MEIANFQSYIAQIVSEIFRGSLGQRRHQNALAFFHPLATKLHCFVDLILERLHRDFRVEKSGRPNDLLYYERRARRVRSKLLAWIIGSRTWSGLAPERAKCCPQGPRRPHTTSKLARD